MGKCCSIPRKYVVTSEVYESNDFEGAEEWIRSQRSGRENSGYMFHGPIRLRFDGGWYVAVICLGEEKDDGTCDCEIEPEIYDCTETDDPGFCYYLAGIPGLGSFDEGENCDCGGSGGDDQANTSQGCDKCGDTFAPCELGCPEECSCCWKIPPPETANGVACSDSFRVLGYDDIKENYPEILQNKYCQFPIAALEDDPDSVLGRLMKHLKDFHFIDPADVLIPSFRGPDGECRVELWARCSCEACGSGPKPKSYTKTSPSQLVPEFPGIQQGCACQEEECKDECYTAEDLLVDVLDEWQAMQIGGTWKDPAIVGECPDSCFPLCDDSVLPPVVPYTQNTTDDASGISLNVADTSYERTQAQPSADLYEWNPEWNPDGNLEYVWYKEEVFSNAAYFDSGDPETGASHCVKYTLLVCNRAEQTWEDQTSQAVIGKPGTVAIAAEDYPVENLIDWGLTVITNFITDVGTVTDGCSAMPEVNEMPYFDVGQLESSYSYKDEVRRKDKVVKQPKAKAAGGAGTELTKLLKFFGIESTEKGCKCKSRAAKMDKNGVEWCANNIEKILDWLKEEAQKRKLPFLRTAAKVIVLRAIRNARAKGFE